MRQRGGRHVSVRRVVPGRSVLRAERLLDMMYRPSELAEEIGIRQRDIYEVLLRQGMPHERDEHDHIWLHGPTVRAWLQVATRGPRYDLADDELFCLRCFAPRRVSPPSVPPAGGGEVTPPGQLVREGRFVMLRAECPQCEALIYKGVGKRTARRLAAAGIIDESDLAIFEEA